MNVKWIFDPTPPSGAKRGGLTTAHVIQPELDKFVREVIQNALDQRLEDQPAVVRFRLYCLSGESREDFLAALGWEDLGKHISAIANKPEGTVSVLASQFQQALEELAADSKPLLLLRIDDSGTRGLAGGEDDEEGNFALLCRHMLLTRDDRSGRGGSFGLGKSVLWRFSKVSTVLFCSRTSTEPSLRFIGRAELPYHRTDEGEWEGPGWYGKPETTPTGLERAVSVWDDDDLTRRLYVFRPAQLGSGTTILVVAFFEPEQEQLRDGRLIVQDILNSAARWFWPSIHKGLLRVSAELYNNQTQSFASTAKFTAEVHPFLEAVRAGAQNLCRRVSEPGDVAEKVIPVALPARRSGRGRSDRDGGGANVLLRVRAAGNGDSPSLQNRVALVRGSGMVVNYRPVRTVSDAPAFHAVLLAGLARGTERSDEALDAFLRAAEPPGHDDWRPGTDRLRAEYTQGGSLALRQLWQDVQRAILEICAEEISSSSKGPERLARLFRIGSPRAVFQSTHSLIHIVDQKSEFRDGVWHVEIKMRRSTPETTTSWGFTVSAWLDAESGEGEQVALSDVTVSVGKAENRDNRWECEIPAGERDITLEAKTQAPSDPQNEAALLMGRTRLRLDIRVINGTDQGS